MKRNIINVLFALVAALSFSLMMATVAHAAAITSAATGNWSATGTWTGSVVPVAGDNVTISGGFTVTADSNNQAAGSIDIIANSGNTLTILGTNTLTVSGPITVANGNSGNTLDVGAGTLNTGSLAISGSASKVGLVSVSTGTVTTNATGGITFSGTAANARFTFTGAGTLNIGGALSTGGTFTASSGTVNFNGSGAQTMPTGYTFNNVTLSGSGAKTTTGATINGILSLEGTATTTGTVATYGASATLQYKGSAAQTTGTEFTTPWAGTGGLKIENASGVTLNAVKSLGANPLTIGGTVASSVFNDGGFQLTATGTLNLTSGTFNLGSASTATTWPAFGTRNIAAGTTVGYVATPAQTVSSTPAYKNLSLGGAGVKTTTGVSVNNTLSMEGTATVSVAPTYAAAATLQYNRTANQAAGVEWITPFAATGGVIIAGTGNITLNEAKVFNSSVPLTINSGAKLNASSFGLTIPGTFTATGTFNADTGTVSYTGASQTIAPVTYNNLTINQSSGNATLSGNATVNGTLTLTAGGISTGSNTLIISSTGSLTGATSARYVIGNLQKNVATGPTSKTFEVGTTSNYDPVTVAFGSVSVAGNLIAKVTSGEHANNATSTLNSSKNVNAYWTLTNSGITFDSYSATFTFTSGDLDSSANTSQFLVGKYDSGWTYPTIGTRTSTSTQVTGLTSFSDFAAGEFTITWLSYNDAARTVADDIFTGGENTVYMFGNGYLFSHTYAVGYYDGTVSGGGLKVASDSGLTSGTSGNLSSQYLLTTDFNSVAGTWHAVVFDSDLGNPSANYTAALASPALVANHSFEVAASAIPEFPTVIASIMVAGSCFGLYYWMRKRNLTYVRIQT